MPALHRTFAFGLLAACAVPAVVAACVGDEPSAAPPSDPESDASSAAPDGSGGSDGGDASAAAVLSVEPALAFVRLGGSADVAVKIDRKGVAGDVPITVTGLPAGVTASAAVIAAGTNGATVTLTAAANATMGVAPITFTAPGASDVVTKLAVAGAPGALDESFDNDGFLLDTAVANGSYYAVLVQPDGKVVAAGTDGVGWIVRRFDEKGVPDATFNTATTTTLPKTGIARGLALDPKNARVLVVGGSGATEQITIVRLNANGSLDQGFANAGTMVADLVSHPQGSRGNGVTVRADSSIVVAGTKGVLGVVERYLENGNPDNAFSVFTTAAEASFGGVAELDGGLLLAGGTDVAASPDQQIVARLVFNGGPDTTFGAGGTRQYGGFGCTGLSFAVGSNGDAIVAGGNQTSPTMCVTRVAASGNGNQLYSASASGGSGATFYATAGGPGTTSYTAGQITGTFDNSAHIERREVDGGLDSTFGTAGVVLFEDPGTPDGYKYVPRALTRRDGRLLIAGQRTQPSVGPPVIIRVWE